MKINVIGTEHMGQSLPICLEKMGNKIVSIKDCEVCWIAIDTPVDKKGRGITKPVLEAVKGVLHKLKRGTLVIVSSQIPVGTSKEITKLLGKNFDYAYMPEHMRINEGVNDFMKLKEIVIGIDNDKCKDKLRAIFRDKKVVFTNVASAEMIKHAVNAFLATSLSFTYDISDLCEATGADVVDVMRALKADYRIGKEAYLDTSIGFSGGHLERDLDYLNKVAKSKKVSIPVINAVAEKNNKREQRVFDIVEGLEKVAFWGMSYKPYVKPDKSALPMRLASKLLKSGIEISCCDPDFPLSPYDSVKKCNAIICITPWPRLKELDFRIISKLMRSPKILFDVRNYFIEIEDEIKSTGIRYIGVGR